MTEEQEVIDSFYWKHGPCCAGCDYWRSIAVTHGDCVKSAPVSGKERFAMLDMENVSFPLPAGHVMTPREHHCGDFKDDFDWSSLPLAYLARINAPLVKDRGNG